VGFGADLAVLAPGQVSAVDSLAEALPVPGEVLTGAPAQPWAPHYVLSAVPPSAAEREELLALARTGSPTPPTG
jgi:hypothetical protein